MLALTIHDVLYIVIVIPDRQKMSIEIIFSV